MKFQILFVLTALILIVAASPAYSQIVQPQQNAVVQQLTPNPVQGMTTPPIQGMTTPPIAPQSGAITPPLIPLISVQAGSIIIENLPGLAPNSFIALPVTPMASPLAPIRN